MPISKDNLQSALSLFAALSQRQDTLRQLAQHVATGVIWQSPDGKLAVDFTPAQATDLEATLAAYLDESQTIITALRAMLTKPEP
jgi:hypothetical protein